MGPHREQWRDRILHEFLPGASRLTVVSDPDGLVLDETVLAELRRRGFEVLVFDEPVAFRYAYESRCRRYWDDGKPVEAVVVARMDALDTANLPYDVVQAGRPLTFGLGALFPGLSRTVLATLGPTQLDALCDAVEGKPPGVLGDNATKDFVLRHVVGIAPELVREPPSLLRALLRIHHGGQSIPSLLGERLVRVLCQEGRFEDWPLEQIVTGRERLLRVPSRALASLPWPCRRIPDDVGRARPRLRLRRAGGPALRPQRRSRLHRQPLPGRVSATGRSRGRRRLRRQLDCVRSADFGRRRRRAAPGTPARRGGRRPA